MLRVGGWLGGWGRRERVGVRGGGVERGWRERVGGGGAELLTPALVPGYRGGRRRRRTTNKTVERKEKTHTPS